MPRRSFLPALLATLIALAPVSLTAASLAAAPADDPSVPSGGFSAAVDVPGRPPDDPRLDDEAGVRLAADHVNHDADAGIVIGEGGVEILHRDMRLVADRVVYNVETKDLVADGNVVFQSGSDRLQGEHLELNLDSRVGFVERGQGFVESYYFTGERIEKRGPDRYFIRSGTFTTCEGQLPDWSFHTTSTTLTIDEYLHAWNPSLRVKRVPVLYLPYAIFPIKRDRATGLLVPEIRFGQTDGFVLGNAFYWAPRDNFDATIGLDYLEKTGWGVSGEMRYLLAARSQGQAEAYYLRNPSTDAESWLVDANLSHELGYGIQGVADLFYQSDRAFISTHGKTLEERSTERTGSSFYLNRHWTAWDISVSGRREESLLTEQRTTISRFPEITVDRTSTRMFETDLFLKVSASAVDLRRTDEDSEVDTRRLHLSPELTMPIPLSGVVRIIPSAGYSLTYYAKDLEGREETRGVPFYRLSLEGPRVFRIFELDEGGRIEKLKHLIEPRLTYVNTRKTDQENIPQFDSIDFVAPADRIQYSITNTLFAKVQPERRKEGKQKQRGPGKAGKRGTSTAAPGSAQRPEAQEEQPARESDSGAAAETAAEAAAETAIEAGSGAGSEEGDGVDDEDLEEPSIPVSTTKELLWIKLSQIYDFQREGEEIAGRPFTPVEWDSRMQPVPGLEILWKGNYGIYGEGVGYQNVSLGWRMSDMATLRAEWRTAKGSTQDFLDLGLDLKISRAGLSGRSRYNLTEDTFVENRLDLTWASQCWDISLGYVKWPEEYEYTLQLSLKGIGTIVKI